jgi:replication factor C small subunit
MMDDFLWVNKYAPKQIEDCILSKNIKETFLNYAKSKEIPNLILYGTSGIGKTSLIQCLAEELEMQFLKIKGSTEGRYIDTVRNKIQNYGSTVSLTTRGKKILLIDEADNMTFDAQKALLGTIEDLQSNCIFAFTCNYVNRLIPAIHSRAALVHFQIPTKEKPKLAFEFYNKLVSIFEAESIEYEEKVLVQVIQKFFPDFRRTLNELQRYTSGGKLQLDILSSQTNSNIKELLSYLKERNFKQMRNWVAVNIDNEVSQLFHTLYGELSNALLPQSLPQAIITLAEYQYKSAFVVDQEINMVACLTEIMGGCEFE